MRILVLVTDAYGSQGGIAKFNRDLLAALCSHASAPSVLVLPRVVSGALGELPERLEYVVTSADSKLRYVATALRRAWRQQFDLIICGHINLLPLARMVRRLIKAPLALIIHGVDAWTPRSAVTGVDAVISVSEFTRRRFLAWSGLGDKLQFLLPNCVEPAHFGAGPKSVPLLRRYGLEGRTVLLTLSRLSSADRYKGIDEVMEVLPKLAETIPNLTYLVVGDGDARPRMQEKAGQLGLSDRVVFTGHVPEPEKADHLRLADAFVMAGWGEGFGIVYLEALACGVPVVASKLDASREAVREGEMGLLVDPHDPADLLAGLQAALQRPRGLVPPGLSHFTFTAYRRRCHAILDALVPSAAQS